MVDYSKWKDIEISDDEEQELQKKTPWNNNFKKRNETELSKEKKHKKLEEFIKQHENAMMTYGMLEKYEDSKRFLTEYPHLVSEDTPNFLVMWGINLEMEEKYDLMERVAHQCICMLYVLQLCEQGDVDPRACINSFFTKIPNATIEYRQQFDEAIQEFIKSIKRRVQEVAIAKQGGKENQERLGPGGLDPAEVYESLPEELQKCFHTLQRKEKKTPWNNNFKKRNETELNEEEKEKKLKEFIKQNEKTMKTYGMLKKYDDSKRFLTEHPHLVSEYTANYLTIWCIDLEMEEKYDLMERVAHQCICMRYVLELYKQRDVETRACINSFFTKVQNAANRQQFNKEIQEFIKRIKRRAQENLQEAKQDEKEKQERLGPGGLDPVNVYESLP